MDYLGHIHENSSLKYMYTFLTMTEVVVILGNFFIIKVSGMSLYVPRCLLVLFLFSVGCSC